MSNPLKIAYKRTSSKHDPDPELIARAEELVRKWRERDKRKAGRTAEDKNKNSRA